MKNCRQRGAEKTAKAEMSMAPVMRVPLENRVALVCSPRCRAAFGPGSRRIDAHDLPGDPPVGVGLLEAVPGHDPLGIAAQEMPQLRAVDISVPLQNRKVMQGSE